MKKIISIGIVLLFVTGLAFAQVSVPYTFSSGTPARADEVNANFDELENAINEQIALTAGLNTTTANRGDVLTWDGENWVAAAPPAIPTSMTGTVEVVQPFQVINFVIAITGVFPSRTASDPLLAEIMMFAGTFAPRGWALCDGQLLSISQNSALFSLLGTNFGGDGRTTFGLPDLRGRVPMHAGNGPGLSDRRIGQKGGAETATVIVYR